MPSYNTGHGMFPMTDSQFELVYNMLSFTLASMMATTIFCWLRVSSIHEKYKNAMVITGLVTFIAAYHYIRIFNSWVDAYQYPPANAMGMIGDPELTGIPFNDAYRYMDWLLTVPLLLIEIVFVMDLSPEETVNKATSLGVASGLMIVLGYPGELILTEDQLAGRWMYWFLAMIPFCYVVHTLLIGLKERTDAEKDENIRSKIQMAQWATVISWCTYPFVYIIPMFGAVGAKAVVGIQLGYCISDIISKCGVGLLIFGISYAKSKKLAAGGSDSDGAYTEVQASINAPVEKAAKAAAPAKAAPAPAPAPAKAPAPAPAPANVEADVEAGPADGDIPDDDDDEIFDVEGSDDDGGW